LYGRSVCLCATSSAKTVDRSRCRLQCGVGWAKGTTYWMGVQIPTREGAVLRTRRAGQGHAGTCPVVDILKAILSRGQHRYADCGVLYGVLILYLANAIKPTMCGGDAVLGPYVRLL